VGTVCITRTERERKGGKEGDILIHKLAGGDRKKVKVPIEQINQRLTDLKLTYVA